MTMKTWQNLWDTAKDVLSGKFIAIQSYLKKKGKHWTDNLTLHIKQLDKEEPKRNQKINRRKEIIKIWAKINEKEMKETIVKINKTDKPLARLIKKKREESNQQN